jgi:hypothetical protein
MAYKQKNNPFPVTSCGRRRTYMQDGGNSPFKYDDKSPSQQDMMGSTSDLIKGGGGAMTKEEAKDKKQNTKDQGAEKQKAPQRRIEQVGDVDPFAGVPLVRKPDVKKTTKGKGRNFRTVEEGAGMTAAGVAEYKKKNPGSKLQTAVTGEVKPGSRAARRRKAFCARSKSWTGERGRAARKRWKC